MPIDYVYTNLLKFTTFTNIYYNFTKKLILLYCAWRILRLTTLGWYVASKCTVMV